MTSILLAAAIAAAASSPSIESLRHALECRSVDDELDQTLRALGVPFDATRTTLASAVPVFGITTRDVSVFREGGTDLYTSYFPIESVQLIARHAGMTARADGSYARSTPLGDFTLDIEGGEARLRCTVSFE